MSKRTEHIHLRVTPEMKRRMKAAAKQRKSTTVNSLVIDLVAAALGVTET
jgi:uncharacterized protein (DUF1778 family)